MNTPHNPTGTVLSREQLTYIGELAVEFDAVIVTDEVYEHMTFDVLWSTFRWPRCPGWPTAR